MKSHVLFSHKYKTISGILSLKSLEFSRDSFYKLNVEYNFPGKFIKANHNWAREQIQTKIHYLTFPCVWAAEGHYLPVREKPANIRAISKLWEFKLLMMKMYSRGSDGQFAAGKKQYPLMTYIWPPLSQHLLCWNPISPTKRNGMPRKGTTAPAFSLTA